MSTTFAKALERANVTNIFGQIQAGHNITQIRLSHYLKHLATIPDDRKSLLLS